LAQFGVTAARASSAWATIAAASSPRTPLVEDADPQLGCPFTPIVAEDPVELSGPLEQRQLLRFLDAVGKEPAVEVAPAREGEVGFHTVEPARGDRQPVLLTGESHALIEQTGVRNAVVVGHRHQPN
jgi:hypothetical protein